MRDPMRHEDSRTDSGQPLDECREMASGERLEAGMFGSERAISVARILLVKFDDESAARLAGVLRSRSHCVTVLSAKHRVGQTLGRCLSELDLVILDASLDDRDTWRIVAEVTRHRAERGLRPMLLCATRVYRGPRFELELERKKARLIHVR